MPQTNNPTPQNFPIPQTPRALSGGPLNGSFSEASAAAPEGITFAEFLQVLRRRRMVVVQAFVLITVVAVVLTLMTKPVYRATARLLIESPTASYNAIDTSNPLSGILALSQPQSVKTQVEVLQNPDLQAQVVKAVGPVSLSVKQVEDTNLLEANAEATDPQMAAGGANKLLQLYIDQDTNQSLGEMRSAADFARRKEAEAHAQLTQAANQLEAFKNKNHIAELTAERTVQIQRVANLTNDVETATSNLNAYQSQAETLRGQLAHLPATITSQVRTTNLTAKTKQDRLADLKLEREGLTQSGGFTDRAPRIIALDAQIRALAAQIKMQPVLSSTETIAPNTRRDDLTKQLADLQVQIASVQTVLAHKKQDLQTAKDAVNHYASWDTAMNRLTFGVNSAATQDKMFQDKLADLSLREQAHHSTARMEQSAQVPDAPVRPKKAYDITLGALFGLFLGVCLALLQEFLDDRISTVEDATRVLGLPSLGNVPALNAADARLLPKMQGLDPASESYRILRTNIQFVTVDMPLRTLLVTSSSPGEGKTTTAANLAFAMVMDGKRVILVDTDLRRPSLHKLLELPTMPGVTDVLLERANLDDALLPHADLPALSILTAGSTPPNPSDLLNSRRFQALMAELASRADLVIFDSPPVTAASDASILASQMDGTILVVETGSTKKAAARHSLELLRNGRANILGVMYNKMRALHGGGYYYYQYSNASQLSSENNGKRAKTLAAPAEGEKE